jgi:dipeptidyl-peptidase 4
MNKYILSFGMLLLASPLVAQDKMISKADLMANKLPENFRSPLPTFMKWLDDDRVILNQKIHPDSTAKNYVMEVKSGKLTPATPDQMKGATPPTKTVSVKNADLFYKNGNDEKQITFDAAEEKNPTFSPDSTYIAYTKSNDLYTYNLLTNKETRLTFSGTSTSLNGYASWVYWEEIFGRSTRYRAFWWNPNSKQLAYMHFDESMVPMFPIYSSEGQHGFIEETRYPKPGDKNPEVKVGFVSAEGGTTTWADFNAKDDQYFGWPVWRNDGSSLLVQWINRGQDHLKIFDVNPSSGAKKIMYEEQQKTWVDLEDRAGSRFTFLSNKPAFILESDKTGFNHLYLHNNDGSLINPITSGEFTVLSTELIDEKNGIVYFTARGKENTARRDLYSVKMNGADMKRLTFGDYDHALVRLSPNGKYFVSSYSNSSTPTKMTLLDNKGKIIRELGDSKGATMANYKIAKTELIRIKSADGLFELPAQVTWPANMDPNKKYPMLVDIYGGPNAGNTWDNWTWSPTREIYAQEGLIHVKFDHRASGHFGKAGVNYMHRNLGFWEMQDYMHMAKWFIQNGQADPTKIAITGFSYGGYMSAYALTYGSSVFTHAMAGGSVIDWKLYDSHYTEKFMDTPAENPEGYKSGSVLTHVDKFKGVLQLVHGTMDDNVHMQNSIQLVSALQDKGKDFEFMLYPGGRHGWGGAKGNHFNNLKTKFIYKHLLEKEAPKGMMR